MVVYVPYNKLDKTKWDACIHEAHNSLIYGYSYTLDAMSKQWAGIVKGDYEMVMPVTYNQKWGIKYVYQPAFLQQAGIFSPEVITPEDVTEFLNVLKSKFAYMSFSLNHACSVTSDIKPAARLRDNFIIPLDDSHDNIAFNYAPNTAAELRRLEKFKLLYSKTNNIENAIQLSKSLYQQRTNSLSDNDYITFIRFCKSLDKSKVLVREVHDAENGLLCISLLLFDGRRLYNMISCLLPEGKKKNANYFLIDNLIREFSGQDIILDLEGSDVPGIRYFYKKFGGLNEPYPFIHYNNLPWPLKLFKK